LGHFFDSDSVAEDCGYGELALAFDDVYYVVHYGSPERLLHSPREEFLQAEELLFRNVDV